MNNRMLAVLLALPLVALGCGGKDDAAAQDPFGLGCRLHVGGAVSEDMWCIMTAYDYSQDPQFASSEWVFEIVAYRNTMEVGAGAGVFLDGRPALRTAYGWDGLSASTLLTSGGAQRFGGSMSAGTYTQTHDAYSLGAGDGDGKLSVTFTQIPPASAVGEQSLAVHGTLTATVPSVAAGDPVTLSAAF